MWIKIEIVAVAPERVEITVIHRDGDPLLLRCVDMLVQEIAKCQPMALVKVDQFSSEVAPPSCTNGKRGGPSGTPKAQQLEIVQGWLTIQGRMNQEVYAHSHGIAASTLRRWLRAFRVEGKL